MKEEIKKCPHCGGDAKLDYEIEKHIGGRKVFFVECYECCARGTQHNCEEIAVEKWNNRVDTIKSDNLEVNANLLEENKKLKSQVAELTTSLTWATCKMVNKDTIDWEDRRFQIAKDITCAMMIKEEINYFKEDYTTRKRILMVELCKWSISYADELITQLK